MLQPPALIGLSAHAAGERHHQFHGFSGAGSAVCPAGAVGAVGASADAAAAQREWQHKQQRPGGRGGGWCRSRGRPRGRIPRGCRSQLPGAGRCYGCGLRGAVGVSQQRWHFGCVNSDAGDAHALNSEAGDPKALNSDAGDAQSPKENAAAVLVCGGWLAGFIRAFHPLKACSGAPIN